MLRVFFGFSIIYFTNILGASAQNSKLENVPELANQNRSLRGYTYGAEQVFLPANSECSRYYIKLPAERVIENAVILWNTTQDTLLAFYEDGPVTLCDNPHYIKRTMRTLFYANSVCDISAFINRKINNDIEFPVLARALDVNNNKKFTVGNRTRMLQITIGQENNFASLLFKMPPELGGTVNYSVLEVSLMRNSFTNKLHVIIMNPSVGEWQIKLNKDTVPSLIDSVCIHHNMKKMGNITLIIAPKKIDSPEKSLSRDRDASGVISTGQQNTVKVKSSFLKTWNDYNGKVTKNDMKMGEGNYLLADLAQRTNGLENRIKTLVIDLALETTLIVPPNTVQPIIFTITNYLPTIILCTFRGSSSKFRIVTITPPFGWIRPGGYFKVAIYIQIPNADEGTLNSITLHVEHQSDFEDIMKSAYVYIENLDTKIADYTKPTIDYSFNNNCAGKLEPERCDDNVWSMEITVTDNESGVKTVMSQPDGIQSKTNFIAGTKGPATFRYQSSCCYTTVRISAIDVVGNSHTRDIDVTAWDNLTVGDIAAIIIGVILILIIIIFTISLCIYCAKKRKSENITFTQRYGSRSNPRAERTNF